MANPIVVGYISPGTVMKIEINLYGHTEMTMIKHNINHGKDKRYH
jgi:hypothetical protein